MLVHGDLVTKERIDGLRKMRVIEHNSKNRLNWVIFVPGMFHLKMACADAFWWIHVSPKAGRDDPTGFFEYIRHLRPRETGKFASSPGFCRMHDTIHHTTWADVLDCWCLTAKDLSHVSLKDFAKSSPEWSVIKSISESLVKKYLPRHDFQDLRESLESERDMRFENQALRKQHGLLYLECSRAMNYGDVGRVLQLIPFWIAIFTATGKHKYAAHMAQFKTDLDHVYPPRLRQVSLQKLKTISNTI